MRKASTSARGIRWAALVGVIGALMLAGCGSSGSSNSAGGSATAQIKRNWIRFFDGSTPARTKIPLLQHGSEFAKVLESQARSPLAQQAKATVSKVVKSSPTKATVSYSVLVAGKPALPHQTGQALKTGGTWQVSDASFCALLALEGGAPPMCPKG